MLHRFTKAMCLFLLAAISGSSARAGQVLYVAVFGDPQVGKFDDSGHYTPVVTNGLSQPVGVAFDVSGNLYVSDQGLNEVREYTAGGSFLRTFASGLGNPSGIAIDASGHVFVAEYGFGRIDEFDSAGILLQEFARPGGAAYSGLAIDGYGNLYSSVYRGPDIDKFSIASGTYDGVFATGLDYPGQIAVDGLGNVYVTDIHSVIHGYTPAGGELGTFGGGLEAGQGLVVDASGAFYQSADEGGTILRYSGVGAPATTFATNVQVPVFLALSPQAVPEPSSLALTSVGCLIALGALRRRHG